MKNKNIAAASSRDSRMMEMMYRIKNATVQINYEWTIMMYEQ